MGGASWLARARAVAAGATLVQVAMVVAGHWTAGIAHRFGIIGALISLIAGVVFAWGAGFSGGSGFVGGVVAGGLCALIGIAVSVALGDVVATIFVFGTPASAVAGGIGGGWSPGWAERPRAVPPHDPEPRFAVSRAAGTVPGGMDSTPFHGGREPQYPVVWTSVQRSIVGPKRRTSGGSAGGGSASCGRPSPRPRFI